jgi:hypothetical protein
VGGDAHDVSAELIDLRVLLDEKEAQIRALLEQQAEAETQRAEAERQQAEAETHRAEAETQRAEAERRAADATPDNVAADTKLVAANAALRKQLDVAQFSESSAAAHTENDLEVLKVACPNINRATLEKTLHECKGDLKAAIVHLQTNHRISSSPRTQRAPSKAIVRSSSAKVRPSSAKVGPTGDKVVTVSVRGKDNVKLGLKFKTEHGPAGESAGEHGLEITEVVSGGAADETGELEVGDIIVKMNSEFLQGALMTTVRRILRVSENYKLVIRNTPPGGQLGEKDSGRSNLPNPEDVEGADPEMAKIILSEVVDDTQVRLLFTFVKPGFTAVCPSPLHLKSCAHFDFCIVRSKCPM